MQVFSLSHRRMAVKALVCTFLLSAFGAPLPVSAALDSFEMLAPLSSEPGALPTSDATHTAPGNIQNTNGQSVAFELRPHCDSTEYRASMQSDSVPTTTPVADNTCPSFAVKDPQTKQTPLLKDGEPLDMDLIIHNPAGQPINRFRAWIAYDPAVIEGELIKIASAFPTPMPGEADFSATDGYIKVSGSADKPQTASTIIVARIRLHALPMAQNFTPITFYDVTEKPASHTGIFTKSGDVETNLASDISGPLLVQVAPSATSSAITLPTSGSSVSATSSVVSTVSSDVASAASSAFSLPPTTSSTAPVANVFDLLQVKHLRVTTEGSSVFLAWDVLPSSELVGYNLYYGTVSGKYLQKRSIDKNSATMTVRALPIGMTYYFAVRGVNAQNTETDFSQEVGISVGKPETSTSPLTANSITPEETPTPQTGGTVSGETGLPSTLLLFLFFSAAIGTGLAFRRQLSAKV